MQYQKRVRPPNARIQALFFMILIVESEVTETRRIRKQAGTGYRSNMPPSSALLAASMYLLVSKGSTLRRGATAPSSRGHSL